MKLKKWIALCLCVCMVLLNLAAVAETTQATPPEPPAGMGTPPQGGTPPEKPDGKMGTPPDGAPMGNPPQGGMGGMSAQPESYSAVKTISEDASISGETIESTGADENALLVTGGNVTVTDSRLVRESADSTGGDSASFYGVGAAALVTGGTLTMENTEISTDAEGGAGVFACGSGVATVKNTVISTRRGTSGGIHVAGGGTLYAEIIGQLLTIERHISITDAALTATGSEALCLEGKNSVALTNCTLTGSVLVSGESDLTITVSEYIAE